MKQKWQRFRLTALVLVLALAPGCVGMVAQELIAKSLAQKQTYYNCYTKQNYETLDDSLKATREYLNKELAGVNPLGNPLKCKALLIIPSVMAIRKQHDTISKMSNERMQMELRTQIPDYDRVAERREKFRQNHPEFQKLEAKQAESSEQLWDHAAKTVEIHYDIMAEALKRRKIFTETTVQKTNELGSRHASAAPGYGCTIYLVSTIKSGKVIIPQNLWQLKIAGSDEPWLIGSDESLNGWLANVEKTAREQLRIQKP